MNARSAGNLSFLEQAESRQDVGSDVRTQCARLLYGWIGLVQDVVGLSLATHFLSLPFRILERDVSNPSLLAFTVWRILRQRRPGVLESRRTHRQILCRASRRLTPMPHSLVAMSRVDMLDDVRLLTIG